MSDSNPYDAQMRALVERTRRFQEQIAEKQVTNQANQNRLAGTPMKPQGADGGSDPQ